MSPPYLTGGGAYSSSRRLVLQKASKNGDTNTFELDGDQNLLVPGQGATRSIINDGTIKKVTYTQTLSAGYYALVYFEQEWWR